MLIEVTCPDSSVVEHLHGKQAVVGSIPILGSQKIDIYETPHKSRVNQ